MVCKPAFRLEKHTNEFTTVVPLKTLLGRLLSCSCCILSRNALSNGTKETTIFFTDLVNDDRVLYRSQERVNNSFIQYLAISKLYLLPAI